MPALRLRPAWGVAAGLAICSLAAITRTVLSGQLLVSDRPTSFGPYVWFAFAGGMALAGVSYLFALLQSNCNLGRGHFAAAVAIHLCAAPATPLTSNDVFYGLAHGRLVRLGFNPYQHVSAELPKGDAFARGDWPGARYPYGPLMLPLSAWASGFGSISLGIIAFKLAMLTATLGAVVLAYCLARKSPECEAPFVFTLFGFNPLLAWETSGQAHNDALLILATAAAILASLTHRHVLVALLLGVGFSAKFAVGPVLVLYLLAVARTRLERALLSGIGALAVIALVWMPFLSGGSPFLRILALVDPSPARVLNSFASWARLVGNVLGNVEPLLGAWTLAARLAILVGALVFAVRSTTTDRALEGSLRFTALALALGLTYVQPWYATWLLPLALAPGARELRLGVALYTALAPALYLTGAAGALAIVIVQGVGLALVFAPGELVRLFDWLGPREREGVDG